MKNIIKSLAVLAAFSAAAFTAHAGVASSTSDLVLGLTDGTTNVLVNLGNINTYAPGSPGTITVGTYGSLFNSAFGTSDWSGITWGVAGNAGAAGPATNGDPVRTAWATSAWDNGTAGVLGVQNSIAHDRSSTGGSSVTNSSLSVVYQALTGATAGQTNAALKAVTLTNNVWDTNAPFNLSSALFDNQIGRLAVGQTYSAADLYTIAPNGVAGSPEGSADSIFKGTFALDSVSGVLTFTQFAAIPEPSTYAAILGVATLGFVALRRRKQALLA